MSNNFLKIIASGIVLDLLPGSELSVEEISQLLDFEFIQGTFTYPVRIADSPPNRIALGLPEIIENIDALPVNISSQVLFGSSMYKNGLLSVTRHTGTGYEAVFKSDGTLLFEIKDKKLQEYEFEGTRDLGSVATDRYLSMSQAAADGNTGLPLAAWKGMTFFPMIAYNFIDGYQSPFTPILNQNISFINLYNVTAGGWDTNYYNSIIPFFFVTYVMDSIFSESGIPLHFSDAALALVKPSVIVNNYDITVPLVIPGGQPYWKATSFEPARYVEPHNHIPVSMTVKEFLAGIRKEFGLYFDFRLNDVFIYTINEVISGKETVDITTNSEARPVVEFLESQGIKLIQNKDAITARSEELSGVVANEKLRIGGLYAGTFDTEADLPILPGIYTDHSWALIRENNKWYNPDPTVGTWFQRFENFEEKIINPGRQVISGIPGTTYMYKGIDYYEEELNPGSGREKLLPQIHCAASESYIQSFNPLGLTLLFWRGFQEDNTGGSAGSSTALSYPLGTSGYLDYWEQVIGEPLNLHVDGTHGIYEVCLKPLINILYLGNKSITQRITASAADVINLTPFKRVVRKGVEFIMLSKKFIANNSKIKECELDLIKRK